MIKVYESSEKQFDDNGLGTIQPISCVETKKSQLNGWYVDITAKIESDSILKQDNIVLVETKEKGAQPFRISNVIKNDRTISFKARHVLFDAERYILLDVRPTELGAVSYVTWCNERTDKESPYNIVGDATGSGTNYFVRKTLLDALQQAIDTFDCVIDADGWNIGVYQSRGEDRGFNIIYGKNAQGTKVEENWNDVCTKILPEGSNELLLDEIYLESEVQYEQPYTRKVDFNIPDKDENDIEYTEGQKKEILRNLAEEYLEKNCVPKISYEVKSDVPQELNVWDVVHIKHPVVTIDANVKEYTFDTEGKRVKTIVFGNYDNSIKRLFESKIDQTTKTAQLETEKKVEQKNSRYVDGMMKMSSLITNVMGLYISKVDEDGKPIIYAHDMPQLEDSKNVWRLAGNVISGSIDGGKTWNIATSPDGQIVATVMSVIGLSADWINAGQMSVERLIGKIKANSDVTIEWDSITDAKTKATKITKDTVTTEFVDALNVKAGSVDAENITGTTIKGKTFETYGNGTYSNKKTTVSSGKISQYLDTDIKTEISENTKADYYEAAIEVNSPSKKTEIGAGMAKFSDYIIANEFDSRYAMRGNDWKHSYATQWTGSELQFKVDDTWVWSSSDERLKKNVSQIMDEYIDAIGHVNLVQYNIDRALYSDKEIYFGAIAQDIIKELDDAGLSEDNLKMISKNKITEEDQNEYYGLDYEQFLILRLAAAEKRISTLEKKLESLGGKTNE